MLVLTRRPSEVIYLDFSDMTDEQLLALRTGMPLEVTVVETRGDKVKLGFDAPHAVRINRKEVAQRQAVGAMV